MACGDNPAASARKPKPVKSQGGVGEVATSFTHVCVCVVCVCVCQERHDGADTKRETDIKSQLKSEPI